MAGSGAGGGPDEVVPPASQAPGFVAGAARRRAVAGCQDRGMIEIRTAHTADLGVVTLESARALFEEVFEEDMSEHDWEHALGGVHALAWEGAELIGHASVIQRRLLHGGRALRTGYIEGVCVRANRRGRGHGAALMEALERVVRGAYDLGALGATAAAAKFYAARGWERWRGPTSALTPKGIIRTEEDDGSIYVLPAAVPLDLSGELTCDWRDGDVW
ncbi:MAG TPA: GNAT family N-acetyltransferase [Solirubrobacterales bacterium]|nr:GNAT family N-acetyltransferase [Solirubrobacterales bacterium]